MICKNCGKEFDGKFCPECGTPISEPISEGELQKNNLHTEATTPSNPITPDASNKKPIYKKWWFWVIIVVVIIGVIGGAGNTDQDTNTVDDNKTPVEDQVKDNDNDSTSDVDSDVDSQIDNQEPEPEPEVFNPVDYQTGITYENLARNPDDYVASKVAFNCEVVQILEGDGQVQGRFAVDGDYDQMLYVGYDPSILDSRVLEGDTLTIYGYSIGIIEYESTLGGKISIPGVLIEKILY